MIRLVLLFFPLLLFVLIRQIYANLLGINRDLLTGALVAGLAVFALLAFQARMREVRRDLLLLDGINLVQFHFAAIAIYAYYVAGRIEPDQAIFAVYYNCVAPFLIYSGFLIRRLKPLTQRAALVALGCAYVVTFCVAVCESAGIDFWLFHYDRWTLQRNYLGIARASGLYGTQLDYGLLSFLAFVVGFYCNNRRRHWFSITIMVTGVIGIVLSMSRIWLAALAVVVVLHLVRSKSLKAKLKVAGASLLMVAALYNVADQLGVVDMLRATDTTTQDSNEGHLWFFQNAPQWMNEFMLVGIGPGTQNGPDEHDTKIVSDFLWLATLLEFGTLLGMFLVLCRVATIFLILRRSFASPPHDALRSITIAVCVSFFLASFIDSAYAHPVSVAAFYVIGGVLLHDADPQLVGIKSSYGPELQPALAR
jgi:hypothetical protein